MGKPRKRFGQHFLCDQDVIGRILSLLNPLPNDHVVEIGPGQGALTIPLLKLHPHVDVIEIDKDLIPVLKTRSREHTGLTIFEADALEFDFSKLKKDDRLLKVVGNLPYNISTPLMFHLLSFAPCIETMLFMVQKEVALRLAAKKNEEHYGRLSVMTQYYCEVDKYFDVSPQSFFPAPKVWSSIVRLTPYTVRPFQAKNEITLQALVKQAFSQRRKMLRNSLKSMVDKKIWIEFGWPDYLRAENLSIQDFVTLSNAIS